MSLSKIETQIEETSAEKIARYAAMNKARREAGHCKGCGESFNGARGLRSHQTGRFVTAACRPREEES